MTDRPLASLLHVRVSDLTDEELLQFFAIPGLFKADFNDVDIRREVICRLFRRVARIYHDMYEESPL